MILRHSSWKSVFFFLVFSLKITFIENKFINQCKNKLKSVLATSTGLPLTWRILIGKLTKI